MAGESDDAARSSREMEVLEASTAADDVTMQDALFQAKKELDELKTMPGDKAIDYRVEMEKRNGELEAKMRRLKEESKRQMDMKYRELSHQADSGGFTPDQVNELRGLLSAMMAKYGDQHQDKYQSIIGKIDEFQGTAKKDVEAWFSSLTKEIDTVVDGALKKLKTMTLVGS